MYIQVNLYIDPQTLPPAAFCPFCGGEAHLERNQRAFIGGQTTRVAFVRCTACEARSGRFELRTYGCSNSSAEARSAAVSAWNRRVNDGA